MTDETAEEIVSRAKSEFENVGRGVFRALDNSADELAEELNEYHMDLFFHAGDWKAEAVVNARADAKQQLDYAERAAQSGDVLKVQERFETIHRRLTEADSRNNKSVIEQAEQMRDGLNNSLDLSKLPDDADVDREKVASLIEKLDEYLDRIINDELDRMRLWSKSYKE